jgi:hypothetical protein
VAGYIPEYLLKNNCRRSISLLGNRKLAISQKQNIADRQNRLQTKIESFNSRAHALLGNFDWDGHNQPGLQAENDPGEDMESNFEDFEDVEDVDNQPAEEDEVCLSRLWMPSTFGRDFCLKNGWGQIAEQEIQLRTVQAEESLDELRLVIGHKSLLYKIRIQKFKTQAGKTRSRAALLQVNSRLRECVGRYRRARIALLNLGGPAETLAKFQALEDKDLKANADVTEENRVGQRNDSLPWFWRIAAGETSENPWMNESKRYTRFPSLNLIYNLNKYTGSTGLEQKLDMRGGTKSCYWLGTR